MGVCCPCKAEITSAISKTCGPMNIARLHNMPYYHALDQATMVVPALRRQQVQHVQDRHQCTSSALGNRRGVYRVDPARIKVHTFSSWFGGNNVGAALSWASGREREIHECTSGRERDPWVHISTQIYGRQLYTEAFSGRTLFFQTMFDSPPNRGSSRHYTLHLKRAVLAAFYPG